VCRGVCGCSVRCVDVDLCITMATAFCTAPVAARISLVFMLLGLLVYVVGFSTVSWMKGRCLVDKNFYEFRTYHTNYYDSKYMNTRIYAKAPSKDYGTGQCRNGLWETEKCYTRTTNRQPTRFCLTISYSMVPLEPYHRAIRAMECIGLLLLCFALVTLLFYFLFESTRRRDFLIAAGSFVFAGVVFCGIGFALFASSHEVKNQMGYGLVLGWSFFVAIGGCVLYLLAGLTLLIHLNSCAGK